MEKKGKGRGRKRRGVVPHPKQKSGSGCDLLLSGAFVCQYRHLQSELIMSLY